MDTRGPLRSIASVRTPGVWRRVDSPPRRLPRNGVVCSDDTARTMVADATSAQVHCPPEEMVAVTASGTDDVAARLQGEAPTA